ncbi:hypothetical protein ACFV1F_03275 [Streptomyces sp. NPDC059590]|uniref:hypothetical protein n=1 Tax=Streptomyces sp. NPDC059590 TaxID=3346877 RepID=UPI0036A14B2A
MALQDLDERLGLHRSGDGLVPDDQQQHPAQAQVLGEPLVLPNGRLQRRVRQPRGDIEDELVAAVLRRRNDEWCARLRTLAAAASTPEDQLLAIFDLLGQEFSDPSYRGSDLVNVAAEYPDPDHPVRVAIRDHKREILRYLAELATAAEEADPEKVAATVLTLADGAACVRVSVGDQGAAALAREAASRLLAHR